MNGYTVIDLFAGCGGISWGFQRAGYKVLAGVDLDEAALRTFALNFPNAKAVAADLTGEGVDRLADALAIPAGTLDVLVGGPPCQGFSKNVTRNGRFLEDPKNLLVRSFVRAVEVFQPRMVLMENVAEMANAFGGSFREEIEARFADFGYEVEYQVHNAAEYGVPQRRRRVVFLASRTGLLPALPEATCRVGLSDGTHMAGSAPLGAVSVWDAIGDLAPVRDGRKQAGIYESEPFSAYQKLMRTRSDAIPTDHVERKLQPTQQARYDALRPGEGLRELPDHLRPKSGYSGAYGRLTKDMIAPTITRWCFHPGSGRFGHPVENRILTIRELARLQSFSDDFKFFSGTNQQKSWQVGNAVPPLLAEAFAQEIAHALRGERRRGTRATKKQPSRTHAG